MDDFRSRSVLSDADDFQTWVATAKPSSHMMAKCQPSYNHAKPPAPVRNVLASPSFDDGFVSDSWRAQSNSPENHTADDFQTWITTAKPGQKPAVLRNRTNLADAPPPYEDRKGSSSAGHPWVPPGGPSVPSPWHPTDAIARQQTVPRLARDVARSVSSSRPARAASQTQSQRSRSRVPLPPAYFKDAPPSSQAQAPQAPLVGGKPPWNSSAKPKPHSTTDIALLNANVRTANFRRRSTSAPGDQNRRTSRGDSPSGREYERRDRHCQLRLHSPCQEDRSPSDGESPADRHAAADPGYSVGYPPSRRHGSPERERRGRKRDEAPLAYSDFVTNPQLATSFRPTRSTTPTPSSSANYTTHKSSRHRKMKLSEAVASSQALREKLLERREVICSLWRFCERSEVHTISAGDVICEPPVKGCNCGGVSAMFSAASLFDACPENMLQLMPVVRICGNITHVRDEQSFGTADHGAFLEAHVKFSSLLPSSLATRLADALQFAWVTDAGYGSSRRLTSSHRLPLTTALVDTRVRLVCFLHFQEAVPLDVYKDSSRKATYLVCSTIIPIKGTQPQFQEKSTHPQSVAFSTDLVNSSEKEQRQTSPAVSFTAQRGEADSVRTTFDQPEVEHRLPHITPIELQGPSLTRQSPARCGPGREQRSPHRLNSAPPVREQRSPRVSPPPPPHIRLERRRSPSQPAVPSTVLHQMHNEAESSATNLVRPPVPPKSTAMPTIEPCTGASCSCSVCERYVLRYSAGPYSECAVNTTLYVQDTQSPAPVKDTVWYRLDKGLSVSDGVGRAKIITILKDLQLPFSVTSLAGDSGAAESHVSSSFPSNYTACSDDARSLAGPLPKSRCNTSVGMTAGTEAASHAALFVGTSLIGYAADVVDLWSSDRLVTVLHSAGIAQHLPWSSAILHGAVRVGTGPQYCTTHADVGFSIAAEISDPNITALTSSSASSSNQRCGVVRGGSINHFVALMPVTVGSTKYGPPPPYKPGAVKNPSTASNGSGAVSTSRKRMGTCELVAPPCSNASEQVESTDFIQVAGNGYIGKSYPPKNVTPPVMCPPPYHANSAPTPPVPPCYPPQYYQHSMPRVPVQMSSHGPPHHGRPTSFGGAAPSNHLPTRAHYPQG